MIFPRCEVEGKIRRVMPLSVVFIYLVAAFSAGVMWGWSWGHLS